MSVTRAQCEKVLRGFAGRRIVVLGDLMLDEYVSGSTSRISREAPVLILRHEKTLSLPGGGANPVSNIASLGGIAVPVGVIGTDRAGDTLLDLFESKGVDTRGITREAGRVTPVKVRVLAGSHNTARQQVIRIDHLSEGPITPLTEKAVIRALDERLPSAHGLIVSDYGNGLVTPGVLRYVNTLAKRFPKLVTCVDSRYQLAKYRGVSLLTPNETEAAPAAGYEIYDEQDLDRIGRALLKATHAKAVLVTRGSRGMSLFDRQGRHDVPVYGSTQIVDVNGAGDSVAACATLALATGAPASLAVRLANAAGGVAVMQSGPASVTTQQINALLKQTRVL